MSVEAAPIVVAPLRPGRAGATFAVAAAAAAVVLAALGPSPWSAVAAAGAAVLVWVAAIDVESRLLPDRIVLPATLAVLVACAAIVPERAAEHAVAAFAAGALLLLAAAARPGALGMGDAKLALLLGALLGYDVLTALVLGFVLAGLVGLALVVREGRSALGRQLPLGPFLAAGAIAALLLGSL